MLKTNGKYFFEFSAIEKMHFLKYLKFFLLLFLLRRTQNTSVAKLIKNQAK